MSKFAFVKNRKKGLASLPNLIYNNISERLRRRRVASRRTLPLEDRQARSRLLQLLGRGDPILHASLVQMARTCGKPGCRCRQGHKHVSWYLATRRAGRRVMIYLPPDLEEVARRWVESGRSVQQWLEQMSQVSLKKIMAHKAKKEVKQ
jgi:hypothetical protein